MVQIAWDAWAPGIKDKGPQKDCRVSDEKGLRRTHLAKSPERDRKAGDLADACQHTCISEMTMDPMNQSSPEPQCHHVKCHRRNRCFRPPAACTIAMFVPSQHANLCVTNTTRRSLLLFGEGNRRVVPWMPFVP